jgi:hypothetical protein
MACVYIVGLVVVEAADVPAELDLEVGGFFQLF